MALILSLIFLGLFALIAVLVVVLLVVLIVKALTNNPRAGRVLAGGLVAVLALVMVSVAGLFLSKRVAAHSQAQLQAGQEQMQRDAIAADIHEQANSRIDGVERVPTPAGPGESSTPGTPGVTIAGTPWTHAVEEFQDFQADVYPSIESAAQALGLRVGSRLMDTADTNNGKKRSIYVWRDESDGNIRTQNGGLVITRAVLEAVATGIRQKLDGPAYVSVERPPTPGSIAVRVAIQEVTFEDHNRWGSHAEPRSGSIALRVETPGGLFSVSTRFVDAPWVVDRNAFAASYSKGDWLVGYSDGTHTTHEEAKRDAILAVTEALLPLAKARISQLSASDQDHFTRQMHKDPNWLRDRIADELVSRNMLTDRFAQRFDRPYGTVWREAVLVDASPKRVEEIARSLVQGVDSRMAHQRTTWFSFVALAGLVFGTYLFLNMATKGYYAWALRLAAVGGLVAAGLVVTHLF